LPRFYLAAKDTTGRLPRASHSLLRPASLSSKVHETAITLTPLPVNHAARSRCRSRPGDPPLQRSSAFMEQLMKEFMTGALAGALLLTALPALGQQRITIDGSSSVFPVAEAVAEEFQKASKGQTRVTVGISGTGGGFKKFCRGETDISNASRPILDSEIAACREAGIRYIELPVAYDALTVAVSPQNDWVKSMTIADLKKIWEPAAQGKIMRWNQIRPEWPDAEIKLYGAGADSGTFDYFTEAVVGKAKSSRGDFTASEDDNVLVQGIANDKYALGYIPYAYYAENPGKMKAVAIDDGKGGPVSPSADTVKSGTYSPLSRPLFVYIRENAADQPHIRQYVEFFMTKGPDLIKEVKYVPLPDQAYKMALDRFHSKQVGTVFGGKPEVGIRVEELLKRESTH
jgi:phosphate transport system substrate-binding protein